MKTSKLKWVVPAVIGIAWVLSTSLGADAERRHVVPASPKTCHYGYLDSKLEPVLKVDSWDIVTMHTVTGSPKMVSPDRALPEHAEIMEKCKKGAGPHIITGPVYVNGAEPGDVLEVRVLDVKIRTDWGFNVTRPGLGTLPDLFPKGTLLTPPIDLKTMTSSWIPGITIPLKPFFGIMAVAPPPARGRVSSVPPGVYMGNADNKELTAGSTIYIPVHTKGALFSVGDGHAAQGNGEVNLTAIEAALTGTFQLVVRKDLKLKLPRAETATHYITMGFDEDLNKAADMAIREMLDYLVSTKGLSPINAYRLMSMAVDFNITQLVDQKKGVHGMLPKSIFTKP
jgi:acetamidase/formamidase